MSSDLDALRSLIREIIQDVLPSSFPSGFPGGPPAAETVNLSTDDDLAAFVKRLLDLGPDEREEVRSGRKRFRLAAPPRLAALPDPRARPAPRVPAGHADEAGRDPGTREVTGVRRIERGAVTEKVINAAAQAGERLVLGRGAVLTPLARDRARASGVQIEKER